MTAAIITDDNEAAKRQYSSLEDAIFALHDISHRWVALKQEYIYQEYGHDGLAKVVPIGRGTEARHTRGRSAQL